MTSASDAPIRVSEYSTWCHVGLGVTRHDSVLLEVTQRLGEHLLWHAFDCAHQLTVAFGPVAQHGEQQQHPLAGENVDDCP